MGLEITRRALTVFSLYKRSSASEPVSMPLWSRSTTSGSMRISLTNRWRRWCKTGRMERSLRKALKMEGSTLADSARKVAPVSMASLREPSLGTLPPKKQGTMRLRQQLQPQQRNDALKADKFLVFKLSLLKTLKIDFKMWCTDINIINFKVSKKELKHLFMFEN